MVNCVVQVGAIFLLTKIVLYVVLWSLFLRGASKLTSSYGWVVWTNVFVQLSYRSFDLIGGNTQLDFEWTLYVPSNWVSGVWFGSFLIKPLILNLSGWLRALSGPTDNILLIKDRVKDKLGDNCPLDYLFDKSIFRVVIKNGPQAVLQFYCQLNRDGAVIAPQDVRVNPRLFYKLFERLMHHHVINPPPNVPFSRSAKMTPPRKQVGGVWM